jgi:hypothetical protein
VIGAKGEVYVSPGSWQASMFYRYQHSDRRFRGSHEEPHPHTAVNDIHIVEFSAGYAFSARYSLELSIPILLMNREQSIRSGPTTFGSRFDTEARGFGDLSIVARGWLFDPAAHPRQNVALGLGAKMPTGKDDVVDEFQTFGSPVVLTVDQSIQPGDGGWGIELQAAAFRRLGVSFTLFSTLNYLSNPRGTNGVRTYRPRASEAIMSVPDQYLGRLGIQFPVWSKRALWGTLAARIEGVPVRDLLGPSDGFRRPGYALSIEPGLVVSHGLNTFTAAVPVAIQRNRTKSVPDELDDPIPLTLGNGDAAFADYLLLLGYSRTF